MSDNYKQLPSPVQSQPRSVSSAKKVQSLLNFSSGSARGHPPVTCTCGMTYYSHIPKDKEVHIKYHAGYMNGIAWPDSFSNNVVLTFPLVRNTTITKKLGMVKTKRSTETVQVEIVAIDKKSKKQILKTEQTVAMVNQELNAPVDSQSWMDEEANGGRAFVLIIDNKAVGVCTTDPIHDITEQAKWMIHSSQTIVSGQVNQNTKIGISRIWIAPKWRRYGLARALLETVLKHSIYGIVLKKSQVAFSQPSYSGGALAKDFNGVKHKSGEILVPVYLEK